MMSLWCYVVVHDGKTAQQDVISAIDALPEIVNWYTCLPNTIFVVSSLEAAELSTLLREKVGLSRLLVMDTNTDRNGWLPKKAWEMMRQPRPPGG